MTNNLTIIILDYIKPPALPHVQIQLIHKISQALMVRVDGTSELIEIVSPNLESIHYCPQLQIRCRIPNLMRLQLLGCIRNDLIPLHEYHPQTCDQHITKIPQNPQHPQEGSIPGSHIIFAVKCQMQLAAQAPNGNPHPSSSNETEERKSWKIMNESLIITC